MKLAAYIISIVIILTGAWFSYSTMSKFATLQDDRIELDQQNKTRSAYIIKTKKEAKDMETERDQVKTSLAEADAELGNMEANIKLTCKVTHFCKLSLTMPFDINAPPKITPDWPPLRATIVA